MGKTLGYMVTFTTYGTWLQGDKRRFVKDGKILEPSKGLEQANKESQSSDKIILNKKQCEKVKNAILKEAARIREKILAILVWNKHTHIVIEGGGKPIDFVVNRLKTAAYYALKEQDFEGKMWTRGYDRRFCFNERELKARIEYVSKHIGNRPSVFI